VHKCVVMIICGVRGGIREGECAGVDLVFWTVEEV